MSFFDLDPTATQNVMDQAYAHPITPNDIQADWYQGAGTGLLNGLKTAYNRDLFNVTQDPNTKQEAVSAIQQLKPDPHTVGAAGNFMHGMADQLGTLFLNFTGGNVTPQLMAASSSESYAKSQAAVHVAEGMDPSTAESVGKIEGIGVGLGAVVPAGVAGGLAMRAASGAGVNLVMGAGQRFAIQKTLEGAGYADMAKQYAPFDGASVMTDITIGALFGGLLGHRAGAKDLVKPTDLDTALTMNNAAHIELGTAPGIPADPAARAAHVEAVNTALEQMIRGEDVSIKPAVAEATFVPDPAVDAARADTVRVVQEHMGPEWDGLAGQLRDRGLPDDVELYDINRANSPVRATDQVKAMLAEHEKTGDTATLIDRLTQLKGDLENRAALNAEKADSTELVRGEAWVRERMQRAERLGEITPEAHSLVKWLLDKNPNVANDLALSFTSRETGGGHYRPFDRLVTIFKGTQSDTTAVHEVLHHTERMMPPEVQAGVRAEWVAQLKTLMDVATRNQDHTLMQAVDDAIKSGLGDEQARSRIIDKIKMRDIPYDFYQYTNPSEFWAVNGARLISERAGQGWVGKAVTWLKDFMEHVKSALGLNSDSAVLKGLDAVMRGDGELRGQMIYKGTSFEDVARGARGARGEAERTDPNSPEGIAADNPGMHIPTDNGQTLPAHEALAQSDVEIASAKQEAPAYDAAVACALRG